MCKYILIGLIVALIVLMVVSAVVVQEYGWTGFLILLGALVLLAFVARFAIPPFFRYLMMIPMRQMGAPLRGARIVVHSVTPCDPPPPDEYISGIHDDDDEHDSEPAIEDDDEEFDDSEVVEQPAAALGWFRIDFTVMPTGSGPIAGRIVNRRAWSPALIGAAVSRPYSGRSILLRGWPPAAFDYTQVQNTMAEPFDGETTEDDPEQVFGERRLQMRVGVAPSVSAVTITYAHFTDLGVVPIPRIDVRPDAAT
jgi:hypothetical protein